MQLKAQDLQTFEAYKKATRAAASQIKDNTPFCMYSDVEILDATKKPHKLRPFLVVGSPANAITPLLKDLHGTKKPVCGGLCSLEEGKISFTAKSGKLEYGPLKSQSAIFKELLGKEILFPSANGAAPAKKDAEKSIDAAPFGKITYLVSYEPKILPLLTEAIKGFQKVGDMDGELKERFQQMDAFSKKIPPLETVMQEFAKVDAVVKLEAQTLQDIQVEFKNIKVLVDLIVKAAKKANDNLQITEDDLKAAKDLQRAQKIKERGQMGPWMKAAVQGLKASSALAKIKEDPAGAIAETIEYVQSLIDAVNYEDAKPFEEEAAKLQWKSVIAKFKLAQQDIKDVEKLRDELKPLVKQAADIYNTRLKNLPDDFDGYNKGKFTFKSMTDLQGMLQKYREFAQEAVTMAYHSAENVNKLQRADILGTQWMSNVNQDKDIVGKMLTVSERAMQRAIHERDGADTRSKILGKQISELEVILSKTKLKPK